MNNNSINRISLASNIALAVACGALVFWRPDSNAPVAAPQKAVEPHRSTVPFHPQAPVAQGHSEPVEPRNWIDVLRGRNVPEKVIARLALGEFEDRWQARQAEAQEGYNRGELDADGLAALARQHDIEQENDLRARLGEAAFREWDIARMFQQFNLGSVTLTASETNSLYDLAVGLRRQLRDLEKSRQENEIDQATFTAEQTQAQADFEKQLRAVLGDERYGALHGTNPAVGELRRNLRGLEVDDQQFATLTQAQEQWDTARAQLEQQQIETGDTNLQQQIDGLSQKRDETFASILGTNGLALFQKQQDSRYLELQKNAARWGIDGSKIDSLYSAIQLYDKVAADYERKVRDIVAQGVKADPSTLQQPLQNYAKELTQYIRDNFGAAQYDALSQNQILPFADH